MTLAFVTCCHHPLLRSFFPIPGLPSILQELQMSTVDAPNVHVIGVDGTSDDLDVPIRNVFEDTAFCATHGVMSANSINVAR